MENKEGLWQHMVACRAHLSLRSPPASSCQSPGCRAASAAVYLASGTPSPRPPPCRGCSPCRPPRRWRSCPRPPAPRYSCQPARWRVRLSEYAVRSGNGNALMLFDVYQGSHCNAMKPIHRYHGVVLCIKLTITC